MNNLQIENPYKISDSSFAITINGKQYEYEIPVDKSIDKIIDRIETWISRGEDSWGGLYDWIKASFKMVGEYEEPIEEDEEQEDIEDPLLADSNIDNSISIPSEDVDTNQVIDEEHALELEFKIEEDNVNIGIEDWAADFEIIDNTEDFKDTLQEEIKEEMTLKDRTRLLIDIVRNLDTDDEVNFYNLINLLLNTDIEVISTFDNIDQQDLDAESDTNQNNIEQNTNINDNTEQDINIDNDNLNSEDQTEQDREQPSVNDSEIITIKGSFKKKLVEDSLWNTKQPNIQDRESMGDSNDQDTCTTLDDIINNEGFIDDLINLNLSLFALTDQGKKETLYFIGGINEKGEKYSLSYQGDKPVEIPQTFDECRKMSSCLNNIEDLNAVISYIDRLLSVVYNQQAKKIHKNIGGEDE